MRCWVRDDAEYIATQIQTLAEATGALQPAR